MITLVGGRVQNQGGVAVPNGSIAFQLNLDATVVASPSGLVPSEQVTVFQFDETGNLIQPAQLWSNAELNPQNDSGLGTYYLVTIYDANGARINKSPMWWQFPNAAGATVDISFMTAISTIGGNVIFYPNLSGSAFNGVNPQVASYTATVEDSGKLITFASAAPVTLHLPPTVPNDSWFVLVQNIGPGVLTIDRNGSTIDGASVNLSVAATQGTFIGSSGASYFTERGLFSSSISVAGYLGWHNVMDYGAVGDSVTDDSDAIQAAINAASVNPTGGGRVYFPKPPVNYFLLKPLTIDAYSISQIYLYGDGGPRAGGHSQFARAPRIRVQGTGVSILMVDNVSGGGGNYQIGDTGVIVGGNNDATYQVDSVTGVGGVKTYTITNPGTGYISTAVTDGNATTVTSGAGNGLFHVSILAVDGSGGILPQVDYTVTQIEVDGSNHLIVQAANALSAGDRVFFIGTTGGLSATLNGNFFTVIASGLSGTQFECDFTHAPFGPSASTGVARTGSNVGTPAPGGDILVTLENLDFYGANGNAVFSNYTPFLYLKNCGCSSTFDPARDYSAPLILEGSTLWFKAADSDFTTVDHNNGEYRPVMHATGVTDSGANGVYAITPETNGAGIIFPNGGEGNRNYIGMKFTVAGFTASAGANNGTFTCVAANGVSLTLDNASAVNEVHAGTAQATYAVDPSSWGPAAVLIPCDTDRSGSVLFNFDFCTFAFGGVKLEVVAPSGSGETFGEFIFNMCALEGQFASPLFQFENVSAVGGGATCGRLTMIECQLADLAHETPLCSVKGYPTGSASLGGVFSMHCLPHGGIVQSLYQGFGFSTGNYHDNSSTNARILDADSTVLGGSGFTAHRDAGFDTTGPVVGPAASYRFDASASGALRTFIADPALADSATSLRDADGADYFGPGGSGAPFDMRVSRIDIAKWAVEVPVPYPTGFAATPGAGGSFPDGTYYLRIASGDRNNTPFLTSSASPEISVVLGGGNNTIDMTWNPVVTNTLNTGHYTIYVGTTPGGETKAANTGGSNPSGASLSAMPASNQVPNEVGNLLTTAFTLDGSDGAGAGETTNAGGVVFTTDDTGAPGDPVTVIAWLKLVSNGNTYYFPLMQ